MSARSEEGEGELSFDKSPAAERVRRLVAVAVAVGLRRPTAARGGEVHSGELLLPDCGGGEGGGSST